MEDGRVRIINISELLKHKQTALIDAEKNCADSDDYGKWDEFVFCNSWDKCSWEQNSAIGLQKQNFHQIMLDFLCEWLKSKHQKDKISWK